MRNSRTTPFVFALAAVALLTAEAPARGNDWMFRRSYFSHAQPHDVPPHAEFYPGSRSAYRRPWVGTSPGFAARGGYRYNTLFLRSGNSVDFTVIRENWFEINP